MNAGQYKYIWNAPKVVQVYASAEALQKPEIAILNVLKELLPDMRMLDPGIGGGRTSFHFEPLVKEYVGKADQTRWIPCILQSQHPVHPKHV